MMHIVRFQGGLGNQLFQLALYIKLKEEYEDGVFADLSFYSVNNDYGGFKLGKYFNLDTVSNIPSDHIIIREESYRRKSIIENKVNYYDGYWQSDDFFPKDMSFLDNIFSEAILDEAGKEYLHRIDSSESVSIHVRRGDYVDHYLHGNIANLTYFRNSIDYVLDRVKEPLLVVFSDDLEWCRDNLTLPSDRVLYIDGNKDAAERDIFLMSRCRHNIISNSSFSWWAQYIKPDTSGMVIAPAYWYNDNKEPLNTDNAIHISNVPAFDSDIKDPDFSILIPVFNSEECIRRCLSSVLNQTDENIEIIVVDDGSSDSSPEILKEYSCRDTRMKIITKDQNESLLSARIAGMKEARGKYVLFVDSDDYISTDTCRKLSEVITNTPRDIIGFSYIIEPEKHLADIKISEVDITDKSGMNQITQKMLLQEYPHTLWDKCYSISLIKRFLDKAEDFYCNMSEDRYFSVLLFSLAKNYIVTDYKFYHYVSIGGMSAFAREGKGHIKEIADSLREKNRRLSLFLTKYRADLLPYFEKGMVVEADEFAGFCLNGNKTITDKIFSLEAIDYAFGTDYSGEYCRKHKWFDDFLYADNYTRVKMIVSSILRKIGIKHR